MNSAPNSVLRNFGLVLIIAFGPVLTERAFAQGNWTSSGGATTTPDRVNIGSSSSPDAQCDVTSTLAWTDGWTSNLRLVGNKPSLRLFDSVASKSAVIAYSNGNLWLGLGFAGTSTGNYMMNFHDAGGIDVMSSMNISRINADGATILNVNGGAASTGYRFTAQNNGAYVFRIGPTGYTVIDENSNVPALTVNQSGGGYGALFNGGNVGIGTTVPNYKFVVNGPIAITGSGGGQRRLADAGSADDYLFLGPGFNRIGIGTPSPSGQFQVAGNNLDAFFTSNAGATAGYSRVFFNNDAGRGPTLLSYGSAFPGTSSFGGLPWADLNMLIGYSTNAFVITTNSAVPLVFGTGPGPFEKMRITRDGNVGVGTPTPSARLHLYKKDSATSTVTSMLTIEHDATSQPTGGGFGSTIDFVNRNNSGNGTTAIASLQAYFAVPGNGNSGILDFRTADAGATPTSRMVIDNRGNVGIGTASPDPAYRLDVNGAIRATSVIGAVYQDVAEWVPSEEELASGTVVVLRAGRSNEVAASREPYDTKVAGVVSAQPGILLGQSGDHKAKIATTGRVRVRVDATQHSIDVGDLLVTSEKPGIAMYSQPVEIAGVKIHRPGTIIGKALEPLAGGSGEILVLLSMQ
jgi:hypothetical protein